MNKAESKKADKVVNNSLEEVTKLVYKLLEEQDNKYKSSVLEGVLHAIIHTLEHEAPSGLHSTYFILDALTSSLSAAIHREDIPSSPDDSGMIH